MKQLTWLFLDREALLQICPVITLVNKIRYLEGNVDKVGKGHCQMSEMKNGHLQKCENERRKEEEEGLVRDSVLALWACEIVLAA